MNIYFIYYIHINIWTNARNNLIVTDNVIVDVFDVRDVCITIFVDYSIILTNEKQDKNT